MGSMPLFFKRKQLHKQHGYGLQGGVRWRRTRAATRHSGKLNQNSARSDGNRSRGIRRRRRKSAGHAQAGRSVARVKHSAGLNLSLGPHVGPLSAQHPACPAAHLPGTQAEQRRYDQIVNRSYGGAPARRPPDLRVRSIGRLKPGGIGKASRPHAIGQPAIRKGGAAGTARPTLSRRLRERRRRGPSFRHDPPADQIGANHGRGRQQQNRNVKRLADHVWFS